jgi:hypothetical protein
MSSENLVKFALEENHVKFRSALNESLYSLLSEKISDRTLEILANIFEGEIIEEEKEDNKKPDEDGDGVPDWADKKPGRDDNEDDEDEEDEDEDEEEEDEEDEDDKDKKPKKMTEAKKQKGKNVDDDETEQNVHIDIIKGEHTSDAGDENPKGKKKKKMIIKKKGKK